jgi:hypothetical protein
LPSFSLSSIILQVSRLVQDALAATKEGSAERNAQVRPRHHALQCFSSRSCLTVTVQVQSLITEVQNIIGQTREVGAQCRELTDKVGPLNPINPIN